MRTVLALLSVALALTVAADAPSMATAVSGSWTGTYVLRGEDSVTFVVAGRRATVALGAAHASAQTVAFSGRNDRVRFQLPGRPSPVVFEGRLRKGRIAGSVHQGSLRGTFSAHRGSSPRLLAQGMYADGLAVVDTPFGAPRLVDLETGEVHGLYARGSFFDIGSGFATRGPVGGVASFGTTTARIGARSAARLRFRQLEVRFPSGGVTLAGTLTIPPGRGPHPAVAFVHGSGPQTRAYLPDLGASLLHHGVAVLAYGGATGNRRATTRGSRRILRRSTPSRAMRRPRSGSWPRNRRSIRRASVSPATARPAGSSRAPRRASRKCASPCSSQARP